MFLTPYDTTAGSNFKIVDKVKMSLKQALLEGTLSTSDKTNEIKYVAEKNDYTESIPPFNHPIRVDDNVIAIDLRAFQNRILKNDSGIVTIPEGGFATLLLKQALLQIVWENNPGRLSDLSDLPLTVYSFWISESISKRLSLSPVSQLDVTALAAWFNICQHDNHPTQTITEIHDPVLLRHAARIARNSYVKVDRVLELIARAGYIRNVNEFVKALSDLDDRRLSNVNVTLFYNLLAGSWFGGPAAREIVSIAAEYPPYFVAMFHTAINEKMYRKTTINEIAIRYNKGDAFNRFNSGFRSLVKYAEE